MRGTDPGGRSDGTGGIVFEPVAARSFSGGSICRSGSSSSCSRILAVACRTAAKFVFHCAALAAGLAFLAAGDRVHRVVSGIGTDPAIQLG